MFFLCVVFVFAPEVPPLLYTDKKKKKKKGLCKTGLDEMSPNLVSVVLSSVILCPDHLTPLHYTHYTLSLVASPIPTHTHPHFSPHPNTHTSSLFSPSQHTHIFISLPIPASSLPPSHNPPSVPCFLTHMNTHTYPHFSPHPILSPSTTPQASLHPLLPNPYEDSHTPSLPSSS